MDFARKQLEKYGWTDGKGLGKNEDGISQALKPKLKRSVAGIGHDAAADFTEHWWTQLYDKAASNVEVENKNGKTKKIKTKDKDKFEITNSTWKLKKKKKKDPKNKEQYEDFFVRKAVLTNEGCKMENTGETESEDEGIETKDVLKMTDEELFAACEGRTAHKGARHGLRATGKLARIAQQEQLLLTQPQYNGYSHAEKLKNKNVSVNDLQVVEDMSLNSDGEVSIIKKKKKKRKRCTSFSTANENEAEEPNEPLPESNKRKKVDNVVSNNEDVVDSRKCKKLRNEVAAEEMEAECNADSKKEKNKSDVPSGMQVEDKAIDGYNVEVKVKKNKKKKLKRDQGVVVD